MFDRAQMEHKPIGVIGAGTFGTSIAWMLNRSRKRVQMWCYEKSDADYITKARHNPLYLPHLKLDNTVAFSDYAQAVDGCESIIIATPSFAVRNSCIAISEGLGKDVPVVVLSKGLDATTGKTLYETACECLGNPERVCVLSGPNHAEEIAEGSYAGAIIASTNIDAARYFQELLIQDSFRLYTSNDPIGASICSAAKNTIAIACGMARGMGQGDNTISLLMTRGLAEISRLVVACGGKLETCLGLAGVGDLNTTCNSPYSRNGSYGEAFAREGISVQAFEERSQMVVEGAHSIGSLIKLASSHGVDMPITEAVNALINGEHSLEEIAAALMNREPKPEHTYNP